MPQENEFARLSRRSVWERALADRDRLWLASKAGQVIARAHATDPAGTGSLNDIEHVVLLMHENRSFDHYFGTLSGVRGFDDPSPAFSQRGCQPGAGPSAGGYLNPFRLNTTHGATLDGEVINDPNHDWKQQHQSWSDGAMDQWVTTHLQSDGPENGPVTMGYYAREDTRYSTPSPTRSPSATTTSARSWGPLTPTDLTSAFDFARPAAEAPVQLPDQSLAGLKALIEGNLNLLLGTLDKGEPYPVPPNSMPTRRPPRARPARRLRAGR